MDGFYARGVVVDDTISWETDGPNVIIMQGKIYLPGDLCLNVEKTLSVVGRECRTVRYSYHLSFNGVSRSDIVRYDNYHAHPGHVSEFHKHVFDPPGQQVADSPIEIAPEDWPRLNLVIEEAYEYYLTRVVTGQTTKEQLLKLPQHQRVDTDDAYR